MKDISWDKFNTESLDFAFKQSTKLLGETFDSVRETSNKSYTAVALYSGLLAYCFNKVITAENSSEYEPYIAAGFGLIISIVFIFKNLIPRKMIFVGTEPNKMLDNYFIEETISDQKREMIITKLIDHDKAIDDNLTQIKKMGVRFNVSTILFFISLLLGFTISIV
jgi:hypothetical protein